MYHDDDDLHMCINCHTTIVGLENYISHRNAGPCKQQTPVKENEAPIPVLPPLGMPKSEPIRSMPSATTSSSGDLLNFLNAGFFFSSLELQSRRKDAVFEEVMGIEEVLEEEFEEREGQGMVHVGGGKWGYEDYVQERDVWVGMEEKGREMGEMERTDMEGGRIVAKGEGKKEGSKNVDLGEERDLAEKGRLRASSEMEENNSDFIEGLGNAGDFTIGESSAKCGLPPRESLLNAPQSQGLGIHGPSEARNCRVNDYSLSLDNCGMEVGNSGHKEDEGRYERSSAAPPRGHTRGKWVPGLASEGMRKSGNAVEYFCQPCNKNIRNRRSYEAHLSTLCHLKKLMSSSNNGISTVTTEGPRLRSRRLQAAKSKSISSAANVNKGPTHDNEMDSSTSGDPSSQNYLMESLGIKRKVAVPESKDNGCGSTETREVTDDQSSVITSNKTSKTKTFSSANLMTKKKLKTKKTLKPRSNRKVKRKKRTSKIQKGKSHHINSQKKGNERYLPRSSSRNSHAPVSRPMEYNVKMTKKPGDCNSLNGLGENVKESKTLYVEEKTSILAEDKFLPISDPHISHGYCFDSLEIQEKQKKLKENIDLVKQKCDSSLLSSSENLQDQMMLGLELMRTEHLLSSSDKLVNKVESLCKDVRAESRKEIITQDPSDKCINQRLVSTSNAHVGKNCGEIADENSSKMTGNFDEQLQNLVNNEICDNSTNNKLAFESGKLSFTSVPNHNEGNTYEQNEITAMENDPVIMKDKLPQQPEGRSDSFFNSNVVSSQSGNIIESMKEPNVISRESDLSKCMDSPDTDTVNMLGDDNLGLHSQKQVQNYFTLQMVEKGNHKMNICKHFSSDQIHNLVNINSNSKNSRLEDCGDEKSKVEHGLSKYLCDSGESSVSTQDILNSKKQVSIKCLPNLANCSSKILVVKREMNQIHQFLTKDILSQKGKILIINKSKCSLLDSLIRKRYHGEKIKETSCDIVEERKLHLQLPESLPCRISKSEINQSEVKALSVGKEPLIYGSNKSKCCEDDSLVHEIPGEKNSKSSVGKRGKSSEAMMTRNVHLDSENDSSHGCATDTSAIGNMREDVAHFCFKSFKTTTEDDKPKQTTGDLDPVCSVSFDNIDHYPIASEVPVVHEEIIESSQTCSGPCPTINVVINVKNISSEIGHINGNSIINEPVKCDISHYNSTKSDSIQGSSYSLEKLQPNKHSMSIKMCEKSLKFNPEETYFETKGVKRDCGKQILVHKSGTIGDAIRDKCASDNLVGTDVIGILSTSGVCLSQRSEADMTVLYCCRLCKYKSSRHWCVERHMKKHFPRERTFSCNKCSLSFLTLDNLKQHVKRHKKKRWFCNIQNCSQAFSTKQELLVHVSGPHVAEKSYACHLCNYSGKNLLALTRHKKLHEEQDTVKCESCSQSCKKSSLSRHMKMHGKHDLYHCPFCDFTSYYLTSIHRHVTHSGLHPNKMLYNCPFCPVVEEEVDKYEKMEHSYCRTQTSFSTNNAHEIMDHINSAHKVDKTYSYLHSNVTEIIRKIHICLGIICPSDL
ncbi:uncharacterized protein [Hetaerina americana]|uniref:uncharacterized protein n=1 Tax=Hetaerina americana TaxID=62018 RepID=UPI003A7F3F13